MKTETQAWTELRRHASAQICPGFADRVVRAAQAGAEAVPSLTRIFALSAATAAICLLAVTLAGDAAYDATENDFNLAGWQRIAADAEEFAVNL
jgi:hypothetical protein